MGCASCGAEDPDDTRSGGDFVFAEPMELELEGLAVPQQVYPVAWNETGSEGS